MVLSILDRNYLEEWLINVGVAQGSILSPALFLLQNNAVLGSVICDIAIYYMYSD